MKNKQHREALTRARRAVIKVGTRVIVQRTGRPETRRLRSLVKDMGRLQRDGVELALVSSGAIGAGMEALGLKSRPNSLPDLQMAAAVGQTRLMRHYEELFARERCRIGQVLLTHEDLNNRTRHLNARNTMMNLLRHEIIPVVNENDVVSVDEIKVGDNDVMAALVALLIDADLLVLLTTTDGLREPTTSGRTRRIRFLEGVDEAALRLANGKADQLSTGGMFTKLQAANTAAEAGIATVIASGKKTGVLEDIFAGKDVGTLIAVPEEKERALTGRKKWIAFFHRASGTIVVDRGAREALEKRGKSLLPIGIKRVESDFPVGALVNIRDEDNRLFARGLVEYTSEQIRTIMGHKTSEIADLLGSRDYDEVIHRDNMVLLEQTKGDKR